MKNSDKNAKDSIRKGGVVRLGIANRVDDSDPKEFDWQP